MGGLQGLSHPGFPHLLDQIADVSVDYLQAQVAAGVDVIQIFDSWAHLLSVEQFHRFCLLYLHRFLAAVDVPVIFFMRQAGRYLAHFPCAVSVDWETDLATARLQTAQPLQGNLHPDLLLGPIAPLQDQVHALLHAMQKDPAFIVNLGHGIRPGTSIEAVHHLIAMVKNGVPE